MLCQKSIGDPAAKALAANRDHMTYSPEQKEVIMARIAEWVDFLQDDAEIYHRDRRLWGEKMANKLSAKRNPNGIGYVWNLHRTI